MMEVNSLGIYMGEAGGVMLVLSWLVTLAAFYYLFKVFKEGLPDRFYVLVNCATFLLYPFLAFESIKEMGGNDLILEIHVITAWPIFFCMVLSLCLYKLNAYKNIDRR